MALTRVTSEKELNTFLKTRKDEDFTILYYSLWDNWSDKIVELAEKAEVEDRLQYPVILVNSFELPQAFSTFSITSSPTLVHFRNGEVLVDVEYPKVYEYFNE